MAKRPATSQPAVSQEDWEAFMAAVREIGGNPDTLSLRDLQELEKARPFLEALQRRMQEELKERANRPN